MDLPVTSSASYCLKHIAGVRRIMSKKDPERLSLTFISNSLDYSKGFFINFSNNLLCNPNVRGSGPDTSPTCSSI